MAKIASIRDSLDKALRDESKIWTKYFAAAEKTIGADRLYIFLLSVAFLALYLVFGFGRELVCNTIGFLYPAYCSMKALESSRKDDDTKWLTYWVVFALFAIVEYFSDFIVSWFPFYWLMKCLFYVWLMAPTEYNGSLILYHRVIRPKFLQYQPSLDKFVTNARDNATKIAASALGDKQE